MFSETDMLFWFCEAVVSAYNKHDLLDNIVRDHGFEIRMGSIDYKLTIKEKEV